MEWWYELFQLFYTMIFSVVKIYMILKTSCICLPNSNFPCQPSGSPFIQMIP